MVVKVDCLVLRLVRDIHYNFRIKLIVCQK